MDLFRIFLNDRHRVDRISSDIPVRAGIFNGIILGFYFSLLMIFQFIQMYVNLP